ncbi:MAG: hypothetical protein Q9219_002646 [cf. Caloplaca sp. 3 TL-2023]
MVKAERLASLGTLPYPTPPSTIRQRNGSSSGTYSSSGDFIDLTSKFRIGSPNPLFFLPVLSHHPVTSTSRIPFNGSMVDWRLIRPKVTSILAEHNVGWESIDICHRRPTPEPPKTDDLTILVVSNPCDEWLAAIVHMRSELIQTGLSGLQVEFIDPIVHVGPTITTVPRNGEFRASWNDKILPAIQACLRGSNCIGLGLLRRGYTANLDELETTVSITVPVNNVDPDWPERIQQIEDICRNAGYPDIAVEIGHGKTSYA